MDEAGRDWHRANRMPKNPTLDQRIAWHAEHALHCGCRPIPANLAAEMTRRGIGIPAALERRPNSRRPPTT